MFERLFRPATRSTLIEAAFRDMAEMLDQAERMLGLALGALLEDEALEVDLDDLDDVIDEGERMVRRSVLGHLSFNPSQDLVASLVLVSMVQDAERLGDFARGIPELVPLARHPRTGPFRDELLHLAGRLTPLFATTKEAFTEDDPEKGRRVMATASELKAEFLDYTRRVAESDLTADMAVVYSGAARSLRRVGAHLSNIASSVVQPYDRIRHGDEEM
ncbi:MAG TPA: PhoU domain-containing protein [Thermoanaerobaculia bacterium]|nr:PhoU domain-containing protein [Thermoanaerobaculia bacterium]